METTTAKGVKIDVSKLTQSANWVSATLNSYRRSTFEARPLPLLTMTLPGSRSTYVPPRPLEPVKTVVTRMEEEDPILEKASPVAEGKSAFMNMSKETQAHLLEVMVPSDSSDAGEMRPRDRMSSGITVSAMDLGEAELQEGVELKPAARSGPVASGQLTEVQGGEEGEADLQGYVRRQSC